MPACPSVIALERDPGKATQLVPASAIFPQHPVPVEPASRTVVGTMPFLLHLNKLVAKSWTSSGNFSMSRWGHVRQLNRVSRELVSGPGPLASDPATGR